MTTMRATDILPWRLGSSHNSLQIAGGPRVFHGRHYLSIGSGHLGSRRCQVQVPGTTTLSSLLPWVSQLGRKSLGHVGRHLTSPACMSDCWTSRHEEIVGGDEATNLVSLQDGSTRLQIQMMGGQYSTAKISRGNLLSLWVEPLTAGVSVVPNATTHAFSMSSAHEKRFTVTAGDAFSIDFH